MAQLEQKLFAYYERVFSGLDMAPSTPWYLQDVNAREANLNDAGGSAPNVRPELSASAPINKAATFSLAEMRQPK
ncbi:hypothetical protein HY024_02775 [Candidatus Curtissbacteria bacterium]|nr:hypothetical protein [Candidatus Curtissbacteria bacterium]